jgi:uncharacterized protein YjiS (DUF1127 family)
MIMPPAGLQVLICLPKAQQFLVDPKERVSAKGNPEPHDSTYAQLTGLIGRASRKRSTKAVGRYLTAVWSRFLRWQARRTTRMLLSSLDDRTLHDIGLQRSAISKLLSDIEFHKIRSGV